MTGHVSIVGAGPGDPELLTRKAVARLRAADLVLYDALVDVRVLAFARRAQRFYVGKRAGRHAMTQTAIHALMIRAARKGTPRRAAEGRRPVRVRPRRRRSARAAGGRRAVRRRARRDERGRGAGAGRAFPSRTAASSSAFLVVGGHDEEAFASAIGQLQPNGVTIVVLMGVGRAAALASILVDRGWSRGTPAAIVSGASTPRQRAWYGRLGDLAADMAAAEVSGSDDPGTLVIGDVVAIAAQIGVSQSDEAPAAAEAARQRRERLLNVRR